LHISRCANGNIVVPEFPTIWADSVPGHNAFAVQNPAFASAKEFRKRTEKGGMNFRMPVPGVIRDRGTSCDQRL